VPEKVLLEPRLVKPSVESSSEEDRIGAATIMVTSIIKAKKRVERIMLIVVVVVVKDYVRGVWDDC
jgi:hypothetical protein